MLEIARIGLAQSTADAIHAQIKAGRWQDRLPGARRLAEESGVSQPTVLTALSLLAEQGVITGGNRQAYRIIAVPANTGPVTPPEDPRRVIILTHVDVGELPATARHGIDAIRALLIRRKWVVEIRSFDFVHAKRPRRAWDHLVPLDPRIPLIGVFGRPPLAQWAARHGMRIAFFGGIRTELEVPMVAVKSSLLVQEAVARLTGLGHSRIVMPLCERPPSFRTSLQHAMREQLEAAGTSFVPSYHTPDSDYMTPEVLWRILEGVFSRARPTALVFLDWKEMVTATCLLSKLGLRVPQDISLILLNEQMEADWFIPKLTCFRFPVRRMATILADWVDGKPSSSAGPLAPMGAQFDPGATIAPPRDA
ncbi:substrate-binding domain-containing protein [Haloferula sp. BvORR071]|uniref:substrate-binding domain-containing protein n=1 Tax=Haloferula sp. BvORR071 TaxID=1396141 RepID=UPI00055589EF|nr:substrate-binding domain-containing protein [Haloferula sp. BvORR071]